MTSRPLAPNLRLAVLATLSILLAGLAAEALVPGRGPIVALSLGIGVLVYLASRDAAASERRLKNLVEATHEDVAKAVRTADERLARAVSTVVHEAQAQTVLTSLLPGHVPLSDWALSPDATLDVLNRIVIDRRTLVVECGAGLSTLFIAEVLNRMKCGHLFTLEHDHAWADVVDDLLRRFNLNQHVTLVRAPLADVDVDGDRYSWYDLQLLSQVLKLRDVSLLLVDGPPGSASRRARYPALPLLKGTLAAGAVVILDDGYRPDERETAALWADRYQMSLELRDGLRGQWIVRDRPARTP